MEAVSLPLEVPIDVNEPPGRQLLTERDMIRLLCMRYSQVAGNGARFAVASHVRSAAGFDSRRTCDFMAMDLWPSKQFVLHGHEIKVTRADWLRELADPGKAEVFRRFVEYWWLVVPTVRIVRDDLPNGWGLMAVDASGMLRTYRQAPRNRQVEPLDRSRWAALLRAVAKTAAGNLDPDE